MKKLLDIGKRLNAATARCLDARERFEETHSRKDALEVMDASDEAHELLSRLHKEVAKLTKKRFGRETVTPKADEALVQAAALDAENTKLMRIALEQGLSPAEQKRFYEVHRRMNELDVEANHLMKKEHREFRRPRLAFSRSDEAFK